MKMKPTPHLKDLSDLVENRTKMILEYSNYITMNDNKIYFLN